MQRSAPRPAAAQQSQAEVLTRSADYAKSWCRPPQAPICHSDCLQHARPALAADRNRWRTQRRCNPSGAVLTPVAENAWAAERPFTWNRIDVGGRGAVIRLSDGTLWTQACAEDMRRRWLPMLDAPRAHGVVMSLTLGCTLAALVRSVASVLTCCATRAATQSPVALTPELRDAVNALGKLRHIVSPNFEHVKFASQVLQFSRQLSFTTPVVGHDHDSQNLQA